MKKMFNWIRKNIFICALIFICINILINFVLYLMNIRFRLWVIILIILISIMGFIVGIFQQLYISSGNKKKVILFLILVFACM